MCKSLSVFKSNNIGICGDGACLFLFFQRTAHKKNAYRHFEILGYFTYVTTPTLVVSHSVNCHIPGQ